MKETELNKVFINPTSVDSGFKKYFLDQEYKETVMKYTSAIREVRTKLEVLNDELAIKREISPISVIKSRIKKPESIAKKLEKLGKEVTVDSAIHNLHDIAGIRVICSFIDDIYDIVDMIAKQDDIEIIQIKDYIKNPKKNGYRSFHMIIEIPVFFSENKEMLEVEIQIRTIAMDFWASLEHQLKYKKDVVDADKIVSQLKECADDIFATDKKMQDIKNYLKLNK